MVILQKNLSASSLCQEMLQQYFATLGHHWHQRATFQDSSCRCFSCCIHPRFGCVDCRAAFRDQLNGFPAFIPSIGLINRCWPFQDQPRKMTDSSSCWHRRPVETLGQSCHLGSWLLGRSFSLRGAGGREARANSSIFPIGHSRLQR